MIGTGYVGLVTAAGFAALGSDVYCVDIDAEKIRGLEEGRIPIWEPGLAELIAEHRERLHFSTELGAALEHARLLFVAVGTPPTYSGDADLSAVHAVVDAMPASDRHALVMKSTVPVGTGESIERVFARAGQGLPLRLLPRVPQGGLGGQGLPRARPRRDRRRRRLGGRRGRGALRAARTRRSSAPTSSRPRWSSSPPTRSSRRRSRSSTRSRTCARRPAPTSSRSRAAWAWTTASARSSSRRGSASAAPASRRERRARARARASAAAALRAALVGRWTAARPRPCPARTSRCSRWVPGEAEPEFLPVSVLTRRHYDGEMVEVRTKTGRRVRTTADHPFIVGDGEGEEILTLKAAGELDATDWLPLALGGPSGFAPELAPVLGVLDEQAVEGEAVLVRPGAARDRRAAGGRPSARPRAAATTSSGRARCGSPRPCASEHGPAGRDDRHRRQRRRGTRATSRSTSTSGGSWGCTSPRDTAPPTRSGSSGRSTRTARRISSTRSSATGSGMASRSASTARRRRASSRSRRAS